MPNQRWTASAVAVIATVLGVTPALAATTWNVPGNGSNVCTVGNPNCNTIAQAVTASTSGDTILVGAGTFTLSGAVVLTKSLTITGAGIGSTTVQPNAGVTAFSVRTSNVTIGDLTVQNGGTGVAFQSAASDNTHITRVGFSGQTSRGVDVATTAAQAVTNVHVTDCTFATPNIGLRMSSTSQVTGLTITGSTFSSNGYGIYQANDGSSSKLSGLTIQTSTFTNNTNYGIYAEEMRDAVIEDSTFTGGATGIGVLKFYSSNGVAISNVTIRRNQFSAFTANALDFEMIALGLETGLTFQDNTVQKNVAVATASAAVFVRLNPTSTNATASIDGNDVTLSGTFGAVTSAHAIQLRGNGPVTITGNTLDGGNVGGSGTTPPSSGVFVQSKSGSVVMPATTSITASCNRIQGFRNGVSVFDSVANTYGGLPVGASVTLSGNLIDGNDDGVVTAAAPPTIVAENNYWGCPAGPTDPACDDVVGDVDADPFASTIPACVACTADAECDDGLFCTGAETCDGSGACVAGSEPCAGGPDCGNVCNEATDDCNVPAGTVCRAAAGPCDVAETCTGLGGSCPSDAFAASGTECRSAAGECDLAETCDGVSASCPSDAKQPSGTACTIDGNPCSLDQCDGASNLCTHPAGNAGTECRASAGECDVAEACDGTSVACPGDAKRPGGTACTSDGNPCTLDQCDGSSNGCTHPAGNAGTQCRASAGECDVAEACDGTSPACPGDAKRPSGTACTSDGNPCTLDQCDGSSNGCTHPAGNAGTECRASAGACDVAEACDGGSTVCPPDTFAPSTTVCRSSTGTCDVAETCTGTSATCPPDTGLPDSDGDTVCDAIDNCRDVPNTSQSDADGDSIGDACDPCTNIVPTGQDKAKLTLTKLLGSPTDDRLAFKGFFTSMPETPTIDPVTKGMRVVITDSGGLTVADVTVPGGAYDVGARAGWKVNGTNTSWSYKNTGISVPVQNGIQSVKLKKVPSVPGKYKFSVKGKNGSYPVNTANLPLVGTLVIDVPYATTGQCGEAKFPATPPAKPSCIVVSNGNTVKCK